MKSEQVRNNFNDLAGTYRDDARRKLIPCFDDFYRIGISILACRKAVPRVLDLGAGTGLYSNFLMQRYPDAEITLIDFSEEMLNLAKERFRNREHVNYILGDYTKHMFEAEFDIIISALSIHHLDAEAKRSLYHSIYNLLAPGGEFLNADEVRSPFPDLQKSYEEIWFEEIKNAGLNEQEIGRIRQSMLLDDPSPMESQIKWLLEAGFSRADCIYKHLNFAVFYAGK